MSDINIKVSIISSGAINSIKALEKETQSLEKGFGSLNLAIKNGSGFLANFAANLASSAVLGGFNAITRAANNLFDTLISDGVKAAREQEDAINSLNVALKASGQFSESTSKSIQDFASELQKTSKFADETILQNAALIQSLGQLDEKGLKRATQAAADLSAALKIDLASAATLVGKAAVGEVGSFSRYGVAIQKGTTDAETFTNALTELEAKFGGAAKGEINTFSGALALTNNAFGEILETIGNVFIKNEFLIDIVKSLNSVFVSLQLSLQANSGTFVQLLNAVISLLPSTETLKNVFLGFIEALVSTAKFAIDLIQNFKDLNQFIDDNATAVEAATIAVGLGAGAFGLYSLAINAAAIATGIAAVATTAFTAILAVLTSPITLVIAGLSVLGIAVFALVKYWDDVSLAMRNFAADAIESILPAVNIVLTSLGALVGVFNSDLGASIEKAKTSLKSLVEELRQEKVVNEEVKSSIVGVGDLRLAESQRSIAIEEDKSNKLVDIKKQEDAELKALQEAKKALDEETRITEADLLAVSREEELILLAENLGAEEAIRFAARQRELEEQGKHDLAKLELERKLIQSQNKSLLDREKKEKDAAKAQVTLDNNTASARVNIAENVANLLTAVSGKQTKLAFAISKGAAIAQSIISTNVAAALARANPPGPPATEPLAQATLIAGRLNTAAIAATAIQGFASGGIVPGNSLTGDRVPANLNSGEMVLNRAQQAQLLGIANGSQTPNSSGSNQGEMVINTVVQLDGEVVARAVSRQVADGFKLGEVV